MSTLTAARMKGSIVQNNQGILGTEVGLSRSPGVIWPALTDSVQQSSYRQDRV